MGTPYFAVPTLKKIFEEGYQIAAVITAPDKPSGRGLKVQCSDVKIFAEQNQLNILQPENLKNENFIQQLRDLNADIMVVVAFRMLPEVIWKMPPLGTFNLHASLLPQYRGAAPINHAIINGEKFTGLTTFFLEQEIDTGSILFQEKVQIGDTEDAGELHDRLMEKGANLVIKTLKAIESKSIKTIPQSSIFGKNTRLHPAPKIFKENCKINWQANIDVVFNFIRGLSPYPAAHTELTDQNGNHHYIKIFKVSKLELKSQIEAGSILSDGKNFLHIACADGSLEILELQMAGRKRMNVGEFLKGNDVSKFIGCRKNA